jgi:hypothetical protein
MATNLRACQTSKFWNQSKSHMCVKGSTEETLDFSAEGAEKRRPGFYTIQQLGQRGS